MNKTEKFWDKLENKFDKRAQKFGKQDYIKISENTKKYINSSDFVLDNGSATGIITYEITESMKEIHGLDISSKMIEAAKRKAVERNIENVDFAQATIFDERYKTESFDVILVFNILHALEDNQQAMQRIAELLKPGGLFISITPCLKEKMRFLNKFELSFYLLLSKIGLLPNVLTRFKFSELEDLIANGNLQIIETEKIYHRMSSYFVVAKKI